MNESEVAQIRQNIEQECYAMKAGLTGYAVMSKHSTINHKYDMLGFYQDQLEKMVGREQAALITVEAYQKIME
jgi:hypothetical protein